MRESEGQFLLEGWHLIEEALKAKQKISLLVFDSERELKEDEAKILKAASSVADEVLVGNAKHLVQIVNTRSSQGIVALMDQNRMEWGTFRARFQEMETVRLVALDTVGDPGNCGTILRAASWFGLDGAVFGDGSAELENDKVTRASIGAIFQMPISVGVHLGNELRSLKADGFTIIGSSLEGSESLESYEWPKKAVLVIGNEARGLSKAIRTACDSLVMIPRFGKGESLNAGVAASVFFAQWRMG